VRKAYLSVYLSVGFKKGLMKRGISTLNMGCTIPYTGDQDWINGRKRKAHEHRHSLLSLLSVSHEKMKFLYNTFLPP
jgi:hypothetical protein